MEQFCPNRNCRAKIGNLPEKATVVKGKVSFEKIVKCPGCRKHVHVYSVQDDIPLLVIYSQKPRELSDDQYRASLLRRRRSSRGA